ncbi:outer membrane protein assembly factor BamD [Dysgonomonas sp. 520]|uniref:outer membrane protein assembly factor BamD n=1 Tax=Dysgonomonas sp. 520 TaxID=2302931 RepID=UPI0013D7748C|nr:outer membrane protein assembly factor BamD [Dysgonomonas sp. 520]NDW10373.1 outer membrane protein assembly factor BamD [Dysgonomonas sp. 520]
MRVKLLYIFVLAVVMMSCGEYNKILKSNDVDLKYTYAKKYYEEKKYNRAYTLLEELQPYLKGTSRAEEGLFLLAQSFFYDKDYITSSSYYTAYYTTYPRGEYAEICRFQAAYGSYLSSPDPRLDQTTTVKSIQQFLEFMEFYPQSEKSKLAQEYVFELQEKLAYKEVMACRLYYNLGNYMGNNYESCVVTAREALKNYPYSKFAEEYQVLIVKSRYELAINSVAERQPLRYRDVIDEYFNYINMFPEGKSRKEIEKYYNSAVKSVEQKDHSSTSKGSKS